MNAKYLLTRSHLDFLFCFFAVIFYSEKTTNYRAQSVGNFPLTFFRFLMN